MGDTEYRNDDTDDCGGDEESHEVSCECEVCETERVRVERQHGKHGYDYRCQHCRTERQRHNAERSLREDALYRAISDRTLPHSQRRRAYEYVVEHGLYREMRLREITWRWERDEEDGRDQEHD